MGVAGSGRGWAEWVERGGAGWRGRRLVWERAQWGGRTGWCWTERNRVGGLDRKGRGEGERAELGGRGGTKERGGTGAGAGGGGRVWKVAYLRWAWNDAHHPSDVRWCAERAA